MSRKFNTAAHIADFNTLRTKTANQPFSDRYLKEMLRSRGIISNSVFLNALYDSGIFRQTEQGLLCFNNPKKPIHVSKLEQVYQRYKEKVDMYRHNRESKKKIKDVMERPDIRAAIALLRENGMEVYKKVK